MNMFVHKKIEVEKKEKKKLNRERGKKEELLGKFMNKTDFTKVRLLHKIKKMPPPPSRI